MAANVESVMGFPVTTLSMAALVEECAGLVNNSDQGSKPAHVACIDPHTLMLAQRDEEYARALRSAWRLLPDGVGIALASRLFGQRQITRRVTGPDFFERLSAHLDATTPCHISYFFLGTTDETLRRILDQMRRRYPRIEVAGTFAPPFCDRFDAADSEAMVAAVNESGAKVLWVGMTAPKQEIWTLHNAQALSCVRLVGSIGAAFDYFAETRRRAPALVQRLGLESHYRMLQQPRTGGRRILNTYQFCARLVAQRLRSSS